ncbi:MAG: shikimate dehydrogenase [Cyclobacteriaceae bacterium]
MKRYGLVGHPLGHSFSKAYFEKKFEKLGLTSTHRYDLYELEYLKDFNAIWDRVPDLEGVNVTIPHKVNIIRFLDQLDPSVHKVEAVNVVRRKNGMLIGYNSDYYGFKISLEKWLPNKDMGALVFGSGGASLAVQAALLDLDIDFEVVSRRADKGDMLYTKLIKDESIMADNKLLINTTPLGQHPDVNDGPPIPYELITGDHFLYDLVYNPKETFFMKQGLKVGAQAKNGLDMLKLQAEKSWQIWNS